MFVFMPGGPAAQLANLSFLLAALVSDVLLIRLFLVLAYVWLLVTSLLGMPRWPSMEPTGGLAVDSLVWASLCLAFHGLSLIRLLYDERRVRFRTEDEEQLWRFFYRRSGMGRLEFKQVLRFGRWRRVKAGEPIIQGHETYLHFCILVEGLASLQHACCGHKEPPRLQYSGCCFDLNLLNLFGVYLQFEKSEEHILSVHAVTDCLLFTFDAEAMSAMATKTAPAVGAFWRSFALCTMGLYFSHRSHATQRLVCATGEEESDDVLKGGRSRDFTDPLRRYESQAPSLMGVLRWLRRSFHPLPPPGLRHTQLPVTGIMARNRLIALKTAKAAAAIERDGSVGGWSAQEASEASVHGGQLARHYLQHLQSLRRIDETSVEEILEEVGVTTPRGRSTSCSGAGSAGGSRRGRSLALAWGWGTSVGGSPSAPGKQGVAQSWAIGRARSLSAGAEGRHAAGGRRSFESSPGAGGLLHMAVQRPHSAAAGYAANVAAEAEAAGSPPGSGLLAVCRAANAGSPRLHHRLHLGLPGSAREAESGAIVAGSRVQLLQLSEYDLESGAGGQPRSFSEQRESAHGGRGSVFNIHADSSSSGQAGSREGSRHG